MLIKNLYNHIIVNKEQLMEFWCTHNSSLGPIRSHDDDVAPVLPHHSPEGGHCVGEGTLCSYVGSRGLPESLHTSSQQTHPLSLEHFQLYMYTEEFPMDTRVQRIDKKV